MHYEKFADGTVKCIEDEIPFELPEGWAWCRISNIAQVLNGDRGKNYPAKNKLQKDGIPFVSALNIEHGTISKEKLLCLTEEQYNLLGAGKLIYNDIVYCIRGSLGKCGIYPYDIGAIASSLVIVRSILREDSIIKYIYTYLCTELSKDEIGKYDSGSAQPNLAAKDFLKFFIPLPPLSEMGEILDRIDKSLNLIDSIGKNKDEAKELVSVLKTKILDLAIRGKLVPQDPNDESASVLLERIRAEKEELIKQGKIKRDKKESIIFKGDDNSYYEKFVDSVENITDEIPFEVAQGVELVRLKSLWGLLSGRDLAPSEYNDCGKGIPYITGASNFVNGEIQINRWTEKPQVISYVGDLLITCKGTIGEIAINDFGEAHLARQIMAIRNILDLNLDYLAICIKYHIEFIKASAKGLIPGVSREDILNLILPIPTKIQQTTTVQKVNELFAIIDTIEKSLN